MFPAGAVCVWINDVERGVAGGAGVSADLYHPEERPMGLGSGRALDAELTNAPPPPPPRPLSDS